MGPARGSGETGDSSVNLRGGDSNNLGPMLPVATPNIREERNQCGRVKPQQDPPAPTVVDDVATENARRMTFVEQPMVDRNANQPLTRV